VSPLIALMKDQAEKLENAGIPATEVNSTLTTREEASALQSILRADNEFIFVTPERLSDPEFLATVRRNPVSLFVIDEAHCISQWGHDFRPAYLQLGAAIAALGHPTILALTATATDNVIEDIGKQLGLPDMRIINTGIYRSNLHYQVVPITSDEEKLAQTIRLVQATNGNGIVYAATVKAVEEVHQALRQAGENVSLYHGQLSAKVRADNQDMFMRGASRVMVATNAFGMGIDKPDIRFVLHHQLPANLEAYYQESGRAGRDGNAADCILMYYPKDRQVQQFFLARRYPGTDDLDAIYTAMTTLAATHTQISFTQLHEKLEQVPEGRLQVALKLLKDGGIIAQDDKLAYRLVKERVKPQELARLVDIYRDKSAHDHDALDRMVFYAQTGFCRWKVLLEYFGEQSPWEHCGSCDNCLRPPEQALSPEHVRQPIPAAREEAPALNAGTAVRVAKFGKGRVVSSTSEKVTIVFPDSQAKTFLREYVEPA
jgi:ATP-dependent DNA helicase RecQ